MIVNKKYCKFGVTDLLLLLTAVLFAVGIRLWFPVCATGETVMACHWAGESLKAVSVLLSALCVVHLLTPDGKMKAGTALALAGIAVFTMLLPGRIISLCAMPGMACRTKTEPAALIFGAILALLSLADLFWYLTRGAAAKHRRDVEQS